jgi:hypothetical protein
MVLGVMPLLLGLKAIAMIVLGLLLHQWART